MEWRFYQLHIHISFCILYLPIKRDENEPFIVGFDRIMIATTFPTKPNIEIIVSKNPTVTYLKGVTFKSTIPRKGNSVTFLSKLGNIHANNAVKLDFGKSKHGS